MKYLLSIDFETSDLLQNRGQPLDLGAVLLDRRSLAVLDEFQTYIRFDKSRFSWSVEAEIVHDLREDFLAENGVPMADAWSAFLGWLDRWIDRGERAQVMLCGHNLIFDLRFLQVLAGVDPLEELLPPWACATTRDTLQWAALINQATMDGQGFGAAPFRDEETGFPSVSLETVAKCLDLPFDGAHSALEDARMVGKVMARVLADLSEDLDNSRRWVKRLAKIQQRKAES